MTHHGSGDKPQRLDTGNPLANMYGCLPCPKCKSEFRWPTRDTHPTDPKMILCDDCGFKEPYQ